MPDHPALVSAIRSEIASCGGRITFARYMELALYHPEHGYYRSARQRIGKAGDFFTSVSVGPLFGQILARQFQQWRDELGSSMPFSVVEVGGHRGQLRSDVLAAAPELNYRVIESGEQLSEQITGCVFSNELLDAFPVHRLQVHKGQWQEVYVVVSARGDARPPGTTGGGRASREPLTIVESEQSPLESDQGGFSELLGPLSDPRLADALAGLPAHLMEGYRTEINLCALDWLTDAARRLQRGYILTIDYGFERAAYFAPHHKDGHLQCYHRHTRNADPYQEVGDQDITAHLDFTALIQQGQQVGLETVRFTDQSHYLLEMGEPIIREIVERTAGQFSPERNAIHQLTHPGLMGRAFGVLIQRKVER